MATAAELNDIYEQGFAFRCNGQYGEARQVFQRILASDPGHVGARHQMALILGFEGDFDGSVAALQSLSNQVPGNLDVKYDLAMTQMMLGMYEEACANLQAILAVNPGHKANEQVAYC